MKESRAESVYAYLKDSHYFTIRYSLLGAAFGLLFPLIATAVVVLSSGIPLSPASAIEAQKSEPLLWIIDTAPVFLGLFAAIAGRREDHLRHTARQLQDLVGSLEESVIDRTRDLDRAIEVGRSVTQVSDLDQMLGEAVELVRSSFNLNYAQVYLLDATGRNLVMRSASGHVGTAPVTRDQRLPLARGSVVGTAASERQAIIVANAATGEMFRSDTPGPDAWSEIAIPLEIGERVVGVLDLQCGRLRQLTSESLPAFKAVASQLAIAVEHARLVTEATEAKAEIEAQARRLARRGWDAFLDAVERSEHLGYTYDSRTVAPLKQPLSSETGENMLNVPVVVTGEPVGNILVRGENGRSWTTDETELVTVVAQQVGQQIENLRLLAEAERYRAEAERANRRLTREGWDVYLESRGMSRGGYAFELGKVQPLRVETGGNDNGERTLNRRLTVRGETIGWIEVAQTREPDGDSAGLVASVADQLSAHLENLRLSEQTAEALAETEEQALRLIALSELGQALASATTLDEIYRVVAVKGRKVVSADRISIAFLDKSGDTFEVLALDGEKAASKVGDLVSSEGSALGTAVRENRVVIVNQRDENGTHGIESFMIAPLRAGGRAIGTLNVGSRGSRAYGVQHERLLLQVASLLAASIDSRRLFLETEKRAEELVLINEVARAVSQKLELDQLLETVLEQTRRVLHADAFYIGLYDPETQLMDYPIMYEAGKRSQRLGITLYRGSNSYKVIRTGEAVLRNLTAAEVEAIRREQPPIPFGEHQRIIPASLVYVPLRTGLHTNGVMSVQSYRYNAYQPRDVALLSGIASYVAVALENARYFRQAQVRAEELAVLNEMGRALTTLVSVDSVISNVYQHTSRLMDADSFYVALYDNVQDELDIRFFTEGEQMDGAGPRRFESTGLTEYVIQKRQPLLVKDSVRARTAELGIEVQGRIPESWLGVPMMTGNQVIGVIAVQHFVVAQAFNRHHCDLLAAVASQAAIAIENARLFEQVQDRARRERILREVTARVRGTSDVDTIMRTAAKEVGRALGRQAFVYLGDGAQESEPTKES